MPWLLGDSFGQLGQQQLAEEQNRRLALGQAMGAFQQGQAMTARRREIAQELALRERMIEEEKIRWAQQMKAREDEISRQLKMDQMRNQIGQGWLDLGRQNANQPTPAQMRADDFRVNQAQQMAAQGQIHSLDEAASILPSTFQGYAPFLLDQSQRANDALDQQYRWATGHAAVVNKFLDNQSEIADLTAKKSKMGWFSGKAGKQIDERIGALRAQQQQLDPLYQQSSAIIKSPHAANLFAPDETGRVQPLVPPSPRSQRQQLMNFAAGFNQDDNSMPVTETTPSPMRTGIQPPAMTRTATTAPAAPQMAPWMQRAQELHNGGLSPVEAKQRAIDEYNINQIGDDLRLNVLP